jgi:hypothetical protein
MKGFDPRPERFCDVGPKRIQSILTCHSTLLNNSTDLLDQRRSMLYLMKIVRRPILHLAGALAVPSQAADGLERAIDLPLGAARNNKAPAA